MEKKLVIVESAGKVKTIEQYLGSDYKVIASIGHIRQIPSKPDQVTYENGFKFNWETDKKKVAKIKENIKECSEVLLATDMDREGEAIAWHIQNYLKEQKFTKPISRIFFFEITKEAVLNSLNHKREVNQNLVNACLARIGLDYKTGFSLSPLLHRKLRMRNASIGRVQTPSLRFVTEKEHEILNFSKNKYYQISSIFEKEKNKYEAKLISFKGSPFKSLSDKEECEKIKNILINPFILEKITKKKTKINPNPPFITSTLQQAASAILGFPLSRTMQLAQMLYEGIEIHGKRKGLITYMRTDSINMSEDAIKNIREYIKKEYKEKLPEKINTYKKKVKNAQEAHECIRPTDISIISDYFPEEQEDLKNLYHLIWKRAVGSQMINAVNESYNFLIKGKDCEFSFSKTFLIEEGFYILEKKKKEEIKLSINEGDILKLIETKVTEHETSPPDRYTEASLIKKLEEKGIGRPSTYLSTIETLFKREYIAKKKQSVVLTPKGELVSTFASSFFKTYIDYDFTATMEEFLDDIANGVRNMNDYLKDFVDNIDNTAKEIMGIETKEIIEKICSLIRLITPKECEKCNKMMEIRYGYDLYLYCSVCERNVPLKEKIEIGGVELKRTSTCFVLKKEEKVVFLALKYENFLKNNIDALEDLLKIPQVFGEEGGEEISLNSNKVGIYLRHKKKYFPVKIEEVKNLSREKVLKMVGS